MHFQLIKLSKASKILFHRSDISEVHSLSNEIKFKSLLNIYNTFMGKNQKSQFSLQVNLCQKLLFLHNMGRTCCVNKLSWMSKSISVHSMFSPCSEFDNFTYWTCNSMNNLSSYCGLVDAKIRASDKDLPVTPALTLVGGGFAPTKFGSNFGVMIFSLCSSAEDPEINR